jgi:GNAT superfamily N-acetyltransferase
MTDRDETAASTGNDFARTVAFERWFCERTASHAEPVPLGVVFTNEDFPTRFDSNFLWTDALPPGVGAEDLHAEADRGLGAFAHRQIFVNDDEVGLRLEPDLAELGYAEADRLVVMAQRRAPDRVPERLADEVSIDEVRGLFEEVSRRAETGGDEDAPRVAGEWGAHLVRAIGARYFAVRVVDDLVGSAELYQHGAVAMVEDVATLEEARGQGIARACVLAAVGVAREGGADLVFLHALAADWPRHLYGKLGFDGIGHVWSFTKRPGR